MPGSEDKEKRAIQKEGVLEAIHAKQSSALNKYVNIFVGKSDLATLAKYECITCLCGLVPGALGLALRKCFYPFLLKHSGRGVIWGRNVMLRHPGKVSIGDFTAIDEGCLIDAKGAGAEGIIIGNEVIISRNSVIQGKTGFVMIGSRVNMGCNTVVTSVSGIKIGDSVLIAANCYIGGGRYETGNTEIPFMNQGIYSKGSISIGDGSWIGANATILDGVRIGKGCVVGAGSVVTVDFPSNTTVAGVPARIIESRKT